MASLNRSGARIAFFLCAWLAGASPSSGNETAAVRKVFDGDTLQLADGRMVRLVGVNAPEMGRDGAPDEPLASSARALVARHTEGRHVVLTFDVEPLDRHGRTLAYVSLQDGRDLQEILLRAGLAWFIAVAPNIARVPRYRIAENEARASGRGIWEHIAYRPKPAERLGPMDTGFQRIEGTVQRLHMSEQNFYFELASRFTVVVARADWRYFSGRAQELERRRVIARGWVTDYKGSLRMRVSHPSMLELQ